MKKIILLLAIALATPSFAEERDDQVNSWKTPYYRDLERKGGEYQENYDHPWKTPYYQDLEQQGRELDRQEERRERQEWDEKPKNRNTSR